MARQELHSDTLKIDQHAPITDTSTYDGDVVLTERIESRDYAEALAFMEEPVTIMLNPTAEKNAPTAFPVWVNGRMAEILHNGKWMEIGYLPVGQTMTIKRKVLEVIIRAKTDTVHTRVKEMDSERPNNVIERFTSPVHSFSIIEDRSPRGAAWVQELRRRNL
jgi:hypothetical protein